jgi:hypothetical protein
VSAALTDVVADPDDRWRSPWLRACALHAALVAGIELPLDRTALRALDEPLVDELLGS